jgi:ATP-dependent DNA helicase RecG
VGKSLPDVLDRLGVRKSGHLLRAAVVLFGKTFLPDYPQCELRMARFRGTDKTEFLDQRQLRGPAFKLLEEAEIFCQRHFPMPAKIVPEQMRRVERALIPPDAMREILVNALIHRDYSIAGGAVSLAIFDDRVEVWSAGRYPTGITAELLTQAHPSVQRNPLIAEVFHRTGLIEKWGRGTNRVAEMCRAVGIAAPEFTEIGGSALVTFQAEVGRTRSGAESGAESLADRVETLLHAHPLSKSEIARRLGMPHVTGQLNRAIASLLKRGRVGLTIPEKKGSRLQKYRLVDPTGQ